MISWIETHSPFVEAIATLALATFGALQIGLEIWRRHERRLAALVKLAGPAWLARRSLETSLFSSVDQRSARSWFDVARSARNLDPLERHMLATLELGSLARGKAAKATKRAFDSFLAYADNVKSIGTVVPTVTDQQGSVVNYTEAQRIEINQAARAAITYLRTAIDALAEIVPRRPHERHLPNDGDIPLLVGSPDPYQGQLTPGQ